MASQLGPLIKEFRGENRLLADDSVPPNVAVDGQNVDYSRGTIRKRKGFVRTHTSAVKSGGVEIDNSASNNKCVVIRDQTAMDLAGDFTFEVMVRIESDPSAWTSPAKIVTKRSATDGWLLQYSVASSVWLWQKADSAGGASFVSLSRPGDITSGTHPVVGETYHIATSRSGTTMTMRLTRMSDGETSSTSAACGGDTNNTRDVYVGGGEGATPSNQIVHVTVDELRMWSAERTADEIAATYRRELNDDEISNPLLVGYWKFNDRGGNIVEDLSINRNHGHLFQSGPSFVLGLVPDEAEDDYAMRGDGYDDYAESAYSAAYAPILNTGREWTVEFMARLDSNIVPGASQTLVSLGSHASTGAGQQGSVFNVIMTTGGLLAYTFSTTTTYQNQSRTLDTAHFFEYGAPVHIAVVKRDLGSSNAIYTYVNGVLIDANTGLNDEAGPSTGTSHGMKFLHLDTAGTKSQYAQFTLDEVRLWSVPRSQAQIEQWMNREFPDVRITGLVGYWRFNAADKEKDETGNSAITTAPADDKPEFSQGLVYQRSPGQQIKLIAPVASPIRTDEVNSGRPLFDKELLIATRDSFWTQQGTETQHLSNLPVPGSENLYSYAQFNGMLLCCNGVGRNWAYNGATLPASMTLPDDTDVPTATPTGAGGGWIPADGTYTYRFTWYNSNLDIEGPYWGEVSAAMLTGTHDTCNIASVPASVSGYPSVTHWRLYRLDPGGTVYRRRTEVAIGTTTFNDDGTSVATGTALHTTRTHLDAQNFISVYKNRVFVSRGSELRFSDADTLDFASTSILFVDDGDGDAITGHIAAFSGLVVFKKNSIHFLTGEGPTTFTLSKLVSGIGCVSGHTIAAAPNGIYYLGHDGAYLWDGAGAPQYLSHSNQPIFAQLEHDRAHLTSAVYHPETHQYIVSLDLAGTVSTTGVSGDTSEEAHPAAAAVDNPDLTDLFTHYWRLDADRADSKGTGGTVGGNLAISQSDALRNLVAFQDDGVGDWTGTMVSQTTVSSDFTIGFWRRFPSVAANGNPIGNVAVIFALGDSGNKRISFEADNGGILVFPNASILEIKNGGTLFMQALIPATDWYHIVLRKLGTTYTLFVNGKPVQTTGGSNPGAVFGFIAAETTGGIGGDTIEDVYLDNIFWVRDVALAASDIAAIYDYERSGPAVNLLTDIGVSTEETTLLSMVYDEETQTWALWDKKFDYLALAEHTSRTNEALAAYNGFIVRLLDGSTDGAQIDGVTATIFTTSATLSAVAASSSITISSATFPTTHDGFSGLQAIFVPDDGSENQERTILYNTATSLTVNSSFTGDANDELNGTLYIGTIPMHWESPWFDVGPEGVVKRFQFLQAWLAEIASGEITVKHRTNDYETWQTLDVPLDDEFVRTEMRNRGRRLKLRIEDLVPRQTSELSSFQLQYDPAGLVA